jgi:hypothetical protein
MQPHLKYAVNPQTLEPPEMHFMYHSPLHHIRFAASGLVETCGEFDMGPHLPGPDTVKSSRAHLDAWTAAVISAYHNDTLDDHRYEARHFQIVKT